MKLKNKKTGEIKPAEAREDGIYLYDVLTEQWYKYELDLLARWWEYYEEPKTFWAISWAGEPEEYDAKKTPQELKDMAQEIGNYFETREEAEKAVEKLKAWKRLKDKGFRFEYYDYADRDLYNHIQIKAIVNKNVEDAMLSNLDLDLLFGGEE